MLRDLVNKAIDDKLNEIQSEILVYSGYLRSHTSLPKVCNEVAEVNTKAICRILIEKLCVHMLIDLDRPVGRTRIALVNERDACITAFENLKATHAQELIDLNSRFIELGTECDNYKGLYEHYYTLFLENYHNDTKSIHSTV